MLYQYDGCSKISIDMINDTNALRVLVNEYLSLTVGSEIFLWNKCVRVNRGHFVTVTSLDNKTIHDKITDRIILNVDMKVNNNNGVTMKLQR